MKAQYIRWILPILAMLLIVAALVLAPHIIGAHAHAATLPSATPTPISTPSHGVQPDIQWIW